MTNELARTLAELVGEVPPLTRLLNTPAGLPVAGFSSAGEQALTWWRRLRAAHPRSRHWPLLFDGQTPAFLAAGSDQRANLAQSHALAATLDGAEMLARRGRARMESWGEEYAEEVRAELLGLGHWPENPRRPGFQLPFTLNGRPAPVLVALVPAEHGWQVPAVLNIGGWNEYPNPAEHAAILRYWQHRHGAELVAMTGSTVELAVARPPRTRPDALLLAWEFRNYNDGEYDLYGAESLTELAASLLEAPVWLAWWD